MPTLHWIGKEKVINHHRDVPYKVLQHQYGFDADKGQSKEHTNSGNKIIQGDNLEALKSLLPEYEGKIKCIYIDPPYNTGNEKWVYNDNVNHPKIKKWLGEVVGKDGEDLSRHDKWLCMMYPRLKLLHKLLADDGVIFISIDDNEQAYLKLICDEIFGQTNCLGPIIHNKMNAKNDTINIQKNHEFIIVYRKRKLLKNTLKDEISLKNINQNIKKIILENDEYYYLLDPITTRGEGGILNARPNLGYSVYYNSQTEDKIGVCDYDLSLAKTSNDINLIYNREEKSLLKKGYIIIRPPKVRGKLGCWTWSLEKFNECKNEIVITCNNNKYSVRKRKLVNKKDVYEKDGKLYYSISKITNSRSIIEYPTTEGTIVFRSIMEKNDIFDNPKNPRLIEYLIKLSSGKNSIILDSFAGSGTTAHAVLNLNKQDGGNRKFILIEMEGYADSITAERVKRVTQGYGEGKKCVEGTGGAFDYYQLGLPLFDKDNNLNEAVGVDKIREYIWYSETRSAYKDQHQDDWKYFLGKKDQSVYYFIYQKKQITTLDFDSLNKIKTEAEHYIIYADNCLLPKDFMKDKNIIFKKIPRNITRF